MWLTGYLAGWLRGWLCGCRAGWVGCVGLYGGVTGWLCGCLAGLLCGCLCSWLQLGGCLRVGELVAGLATSNVVADG